MSCKFGLASCRSNSAARKYASELAPHRLFDASRNCSSTLSVCSDRPFRIKPLGTWRAANTIDQPLAFQNLNCFQSW